MPPDIVIPIVSHSAADLVIKIVVTTDLASDPEFKVGKSLIILVDVSSVVACD